MERTILAVDLGGTKTAVALVSDEGVIRDRWVEATDLGDPEAWLAQLERIATHLLGGAEPDGIGVAVPGTAHDAAGLVAWAPNLPGWTDVPLGAWLARKFECPVALGNDGHFAALGEGWLGAGAGVRDFICIVVGTGIGSGLVLDGRLYTGAGDVAGAVGWSVFRGGPNIEEAIAGPALRRRALAVARSGRAPLLASMLAQGGCRDAAQLLFQAAVGGELAAIEVVTDAVDQLGRVLANIVSLLNVSKILLGGSVGLALSPWIPALQAIVADHGQPYSARQATIEATRLGQDAPLLGAACAARSKLKGDM